MRERDKTEGSSRREFLKTGAGWAAASMLPVLGGAGVGGEWLSASPLPVANGSGAAGSIPTVRLNNGVAMPRLGFGTMTLKGDPGSVADAIALGYRLIDTAMIYNSEEAVGEGIRQSGIRREELFLTSKLWKTDMGYEPAKKGFQTSLDKLKTDYLDLYLIHRPSGGDWMGSWKAMEELYQAGRIRAIGMSNATPEQMNALMADSRVKPAVHQIETHAFFQEDRAYDFLKQHGVQMEAWAPLAEGRDGLFTNGTLAAIGKKYKKTNAQVSLRWHFQRGIVAIPRSQQHGHRMENLNIFDFELSDSDMAAIAPLNLHKTLFPEWS